MRAERRIEPIDVKRDPNPIGQVLDDARRKILEGLACEPVPRNPAIIKNLDAILLAAAELDLLLAEIADADQGSQGE